MYPKKRSSTLSGTGVRFTNGIKIPEDFNHFGGINRGTLKSVRFSRVSFNQVNHEVFTLEKRIGTDLIFVLTGTETRT